ncbi:MAG: UDP-N-acetylenolpyruvoylglucosamine reductase [Candidatus Roizmanbacteria bacterium GW2011_GWA2_37_7]|uniref:UDP-N-acetylenolpyruvoylglucosamine reductase n=1 Tax=Candidatus Roizmanbacteria bacterium GW2011_GWA2_37_7 TaxID=1618481 RepID=A0A0G0KDK6_9BACT|nr:MAG: UDP-N-acetylenolpyruvoylglucosamine reductase [Candidatus Roizmanbacteria bacterium GW2011_GWA2_37_7]
MQIRNVKYDVLDREFGDRLEKDKDLAAFFTLKMNTVAEYFFEPISIEDWRKVMSIVYEYDIPFLIVGGGSNIAVFQKRILGIVLRNRFISKSIEDESGQFVDLKLSSGYPMSMLVQETIDQGLSGFEYHYGLPGTLGGAIYMNSKWTRPLSYVSDSLLIATIMDRDGSVRKESRDYFDFAYDYSKLQDTGEIFLEGVFRLMKYDASELQKHAEEALRYRKDTQPFGVATGGCFFQNISQSEQEKYSLPTGSAGYLIDKAGLKGKRIGCFEVSKKHANFIINTGNGKAEDLRKLVNTVKSTVQQVYGIKLKEEVCFV